MTEEQTFDAADLERLATKLDAISADWDDNERALLHVVFASAGEASAAHGADEVSGFAVDAFIWFRGAEPPTSDSLVSSFQWGVGRGSQEGIVIQGG
ncbi:MAG TPA: hypothetical protein VK277_15605 [Acidimicrobiales bacterium]|nr:hypothetical protein [Acidimicrobiales bacterium]